METKPEIQDSKDILDLIEDSMQPVSLPAIKGVVDLTVTKDRQDAILIEDDAGDTNDDVVIMDGNSFFAKRKKNRGERKENSLKVSNGMNNCDQCISGTAGQNQKAKPESASIENSSADEKNSEKSAKKRKGKKTGANDGETFTKFVQN